MILPLQTMPITSEKPARHRAVILAIGVTLAASAAALALMGRIWVCGCGYVQLWAGNIWSADNSQHLTDAYPFAHFTKGLGFFWLFAMALKRATA